MEREYKNNEYDLSILRIILSFVIIIASIFTICVVIANVMNIKVMDGITVKGDDVKLIINTEIEEQDMFFVNDDKGLRCKKTDGSFARDEWIEKNGELFYFDTSSYGKNGDLKLKGQIYSLDNGKLKKMVREKSYSTSYDPEYYSSVDSSAFIAYLDTEENEYGYHKIMYKMYGENDEEVLGTNADPQFSTPFMINTCENYIYYLAVGKKSPYAGVLNRMRPGASLKEYIGSKIEGYIVLNNDVVYYYDGSRVIKAKTWKEIEVKEEEIIEEEINALPLPVDPEIEEGDIDGVIINDKNAPSGSKIYSDMVKNKNNDSSETSESDKTDKNNETEATTNKNNKKVKGDAPIPIEELPLPKPIEKSSGNSKEGKEDVPIVAPLPFKRDN